MSDGLGLADAIGAIADLATKHKTTKIVEAKGEPRGKYYLIDPEGNATLETAEPDWHNERLATPNDLRNFIEVHKAAGESAVFYDENKITFVYSLTDRRDIASCELKITPQYRWLLESSTQPLNQRDFVRLLRITFRGCHDGTLLALVRNLKFNNAGEAAGSIQQGRESMARSVVAEVRGEAAIPEETTLIVPIYDNHPYSARIACAVEVLADQQVFKLTPYPLALRTGINEALDSIHGLLSAEDMPAIYQGSPN